MTTYIAIDPGPRTGTVVWDDKYPDKFYFQMLDFTDLNTTIDDWRCDGAHEVIWQFLQSRCVIDDYIIICERFEYQPDKEGRGGRDYDAAEYVGVVQLWWQKRHHDFNNCKLVLQSPSYAVGKQCFWTDNKLRQIGLWRSVKHERDALRHLLQYLTFKVEDKRFLYKLK